MSTVDWIVLAAVVLALGAAAFFALRRKKRGGSCCGDCSACGGCKDGQKKADKS